MEDIKSLASVIVLSELIDFDNEKPRQRKTRIWVKRKEEKGYFTNIVEELKVEDHLGFKEMFQMDIVDFENVY